MVMHTYGRDGAPVILMLHPMGITASMVYEKIGSRFKDDYHLLIPDMGNHGDETANFISADAEAENIHRYLTENHLTNVRLIYGASMGATVALRLVEYGNLKFENMYLDGAPFARQGAVMRKIFAPVLVWQKKIYEKNDEKKLKEFIDRWGRDVNDHMGECFRKFSKESIYHIGEACCEGTVAELPEGLEQHTYMEWGEDELFAKSSPALVRKMYPRAHICVRKGYNHCEYMMKETEKYVDFLEKIINRGSENGKAANVEAAFDPKVRTITEEEIQEIGHAFGYYDYGNEEGLVKIYKTQEDAKTYICGFAETAFRRGVLYTTSPAREAFISYDVVDFAKHGKKEKLSAYRPLLKGVFSTMNLFEVISFIKMLSTGGEALYDRFKKEKKPHIFVGMVVVREQYQHMGYMRQVMEIAYEEGRRRKLPVLLDTDAKSKRDKYVHLGMEVAQERRLENGKVMYDLIWYPEDYER